MIITLTGANFSASNIGTISSLGQPYSVTVTCSTAGATITITATGMSTVTSTSGTATMSNIPYGTTASYTVSASGYTTKTGTATSTRTISVTLTAVGGGGESEEGTLITSGSLAGSYLCEGRGFISTSDEGLTVDEQYFIYRYIPVETAKTYRLEKGRAIFFLTSSKTIIGSRGNLTSGYTDFTFNTPNNCAYISVAFKYADIDPANVILEDKTPQLVEKSTTLLNTTSAQFTNGYGWDSSSYTLKASEGFYSYAEIPVSGNTTYKLPYARSTWFLDSNKNSLYRKNMSKDVGDYTIKTNVDVAYISTCFNSSDVTADKACIIEYE